MLTRRWLDHARQQFHRRYAERCAGGKQAIKGTYVKLLAPMYGIEHEERQRLLALAEEANRPGWWVSYGKLVPDWFKLFLGYESDASELRTYESELVPGLLQSPDYARAVALASKPDSTVAELDKQVELRRERQERITDKCCRSRSMRTQR